MQEPGRRARLAQCRCPSITERPYIKQPCFVVPHATHDQANHAPNENMEVEGFFRGVRTQCRVFEKLAGLRP